MQDEYLIILIAACIFLLLVAALFLYFWISKRLSQRGYVQIDDVRPLTRYSTRIHAHEKVYQATPESQSKKHPYQAKREGARAKEKMMLSARMYVRSTAFSNPELLDDIGHRMAKYYFFVDKPDRSRVIMTRRESTRTALAKLLTGINHPYIMPTSAVDYHKDGNVLMVFRPYEPKGSLRDFIHECRPLDKYEVKYPHLHGRPVEEKKIQLWGRQVLEALEYCRVAAFPYYQLHAGNVVLTDGNVCRVTDYEGDFIDANPRYTALQRAGIEKGMDPIVVSFGALLYELATGYEMDSIAFDDYPGDANKRVKKILDRIFKPGNEAGYATLQTLLDDPFFSQVTLYSNWTPIEIKKDAKAEQLMSRAAKDYVEFLKTKPEARRLNSSGYTSTGNAASQQPGPNQKTEQRKKKKRSNKSSGAAPAESSGPAPPPPPAPAAPDVTTPPPARNNSERSALLSSIETFSAKKLKKAATNDRSAPRV